MEIMSPSFASWRRPQRDFQFAWVAGIIRYVPISPPFDLLHLDGHDLRGLPLIRRKEILRQILPAVPDLAFCDHIEEQGQAISPGPQSDSRR